ncbi:hypothetical protein ACC754_39170, partial [Rhizobium johnstonii]
SSTGNTPNQQKEQHNCQGPRRQRLLDKLHGKDLLGWSELFGTSAGHASNKVAFRSDEFEALNGAALSGMGIAFLPSWVTGHSVKTGGLV